jgi:hypothetical protein
MNAARTDEMDTVVNWLGTQVATSDWITSGLFLKAADRPVSRPAAGLPAGDAGR